MMERLGHSSVQVTIDRYGHLLPSLDETVVDGLDATYRASVGQGPSRVEVGGVSDESGGGARTDRGAPTRRGATRRVRCW